MKRSEATSQAGEVVLDPSGVAKKISALTDAILKDFRNSAAELAIIGIQTRGAILARRLASRLGEAFRRELPIGILDITLYRDDIHAIADQPEVKETEIPFDLQDRPVILVDDVLFSGRTVRSAMNAMIDYARPRCIRLAVLVDRGHRELPIQADYTGLLLPTRPEDVVDVNFKELDIEDSVRVRRKGRTG